MSQLTDLARAVFEITDQYGARLKLDLIEHLLRLTDKERNRLAADLADEDTQQQTAIDLLLAVRPEIEPSVPDIVHVGHSQSSVPDMVPMYSDIALGTNKEATRIGTISGTLCVR